MLFCNDDRPLYLSSSILVGLVELSPKIQANLLALDSQFCFLLLTKSDFSHSIFSMPGKVGPHLDKGGGHQAVLGVEWVVLRPERVPQEVQLIAICGENWLFNNTLEITKKFYIKNKPNLMTLLISLYSS